MIEKELQEEIKYFLKFVNKTYWADSMTSKISDNLLIKLKVKK